MYLEPVITHEMNPLRYQINKAAIFSWIEIFYRPGSLVNIIREII